MSSMSSQNRFFPNVWPTFPVEFNWQLLGYSLQGSFGPSPPRTPSTPPRSLSPPPIERDRYQYQQDRYSHPAYTSNQTLYRRRTADKSTLVREDLLDTPVPPLSEPLGYIPISPQYRPSSPQSRSSTSSSGSTFASTSYSGRHSPSPPVQYPYPQLPPPPRRAELSSPKVLSPMPVMDEQSIWSTQPKAYEMEKPTFTIPPHPRTSLLEEIYVPLPVTKPLPLSPPERQETDFFSPIEEKQVSLPKPTPEDDDDLASLPRVETAVVEPVTIVADQVQADSPIKESSALPLVDEADSTPRVESVALNPFESIVDDTQPSPPSDEMEATPRAEAAVLQSTESIVEEEHSVAEVETTPRPDAVVLATTSSAADETKSDTTIDTPPVIFEEMLSLSKGSEEGGLENPFEDPAIVEAVVATSSADTDESPAPILEPPSLAESIPPVAIESVAVVADVEPGTTFSEPEDRPAESLPAEAPPVSVPPPAPAPAPVVSVAPITPPSPPRAPKPSPPSSIKAAPPSRLRPPTQPNTPTPERQNSRFSIFGRQAGSNNPPQDRAVPERKSSLKPSRRPTSTIFPSSPSASESESTKPQQASLSKLGSSLRIGRNPSLLGGKNTATKALRFAN